MKIKHKTEMEKALLLARRLLRQSLACLDRHIKWQESAAFEAKVRRFLKTR